MDMNRLAQTTALGQQAKFRCDRRLSAFTSKTNVVCTYTPADGNRNEKAARGRLSVQT